MPAWLFFGVLALGAYYALQKSKGGG